jgi:hypothetical protein
LTLAEARLELLRRSAIYFVDELPLPYQIHHGDADFVVTVNHSQLEKFTYHDTNVHHVHHVQNYYRLKETGKDGTIQLSHILNITCGIKKSLSLSPNPTRGLVTIQLDKSITSTYPEQVLVFDMNGQKVFAKQLKGIENEILDLSTLVKGTYSCHFFVNGEWLIKRIVVM